MESLLSNIEWMPTLVSFVVAFVLGWAWYSPKMFYKGWMAGLGQTHTTHAMWKPMFPQTGATFFFAIAMNVAINTGQVALMVVFTIALAGFIKANGLFAGKSIYAIGVETMYIIVMALVIYGVNMVF